MKLLTYTLAICLFFNMSVTYLIISNENFDIFSGMISKPDTTITKLKAADSDLKKTQNELANLKSFVLAKAAKNDDVSYHSDDYVYLKDGSKCKSVMTSLPNGGQKFSSPTDCLKLLDVESKLLN